MAQDFSDAFYKTTTWKKVRESYLKSVGNLCEDCLAMGVFTPAAIVHHIQPLTPDNITDPKIAISFDNLRAVCSACHHNEHKQSTRRYIFAPDGSLIINE